MERNIRTWLKDFENGAFDDQSVHTQIDAGWYDWFCSDKSLARRTQMLGTKLKGVADSDLIDLDQNYVFFKNNCPIIGNTYDDFRICDIVTGDVILTIVPKSGHKKDSGKSEVWGRKNNFDGPLFEADTWREVKAWLKTITKDQLHAELKEKGVQHDDGITA